MTFSNGADLIELRDQMGLRPMSEFDPGKPARIYDNLNEVFFDWDPSKEADHYRAYAKPYEGRGYEGLIAFDGLELLGWLPIDGSGSDGSTTPKP